ncbi:MAG: hypothetical protein AAF721_17405 [Myxococcota bacterium]
MRGAWLIVGGGVLAACGINPDYDGPVVADTDVAASSDDGVSSGSGTPNDGAITLMEFQSTWATPNQIRWRWQPQGTADDFIAYELVTGPSEADVVQRTAAARIWTSDDNPELGVFNVPRTFVSHVVEASTTVGHPADTEVFAQLTALDSAGEQSVSAVAVARTRPEPVFEIAILGEGEPPGWSSPSSYQLASEQPFAGADHFSYTHTCAEPECWENLQRQDLGIDLSDIRAGDFDTTAFVEVAVAIEDSIPSWWGSIDLWFDPDAPEITAQYKGWQLAATAEYQLLQVPLKALRSRETESPLTFDLLASGLAGFVVGGHYSDGATIRIDEARLRW